MEADGIRPPFFEALTDALTGRSRLSYEDDQPPRIRPLQCVIGDRPDMLRRIVE
jgi:hypothetical protein